MPNINFDKYDENDFKTFFEVAQSVIVHNLGHAEDPECDLIDRANWKILRKGILAHDDKNEDYRHPIPLDKECPTPFMLLQHIVDVTGHFQKKYKTLTIFSYPKGKPVYIEDRLRAAQEKGQKEPFVKRVVRRTGQVLRLKDRKNKTRGE